MVDAPLFREGMARLGAAVNLITTDGSAGRRGFTASAVCSVTDDPPTLLLCVNRSSSSFEALRANGVLCVNVLAGRHQALSALFAARGATSDERFADASIWTKLETGAPALADASAALDCRITACNDVGTHSVLFCRVEAMRLADTPEGLIYFNRAYHNVGEASA